MEKVKKFIRDILYISIIVFCIVLLIIVLISVIINIKYFFDFGYLINSITSKSSNEILSLNVGILQAFIAIIGVGIVIAAYFNFTTIRDKLKEVDIRLGINERTIDEAKKQIENIINKKPYIEEKQSNVDIKKIEEETKELININNNIKKGEIKDDDLG